MELQKTEVSMLETIYGEDWKSSGDATRGFSDNVAGVLKEVAGQLREIGETAESIAESIDSVSETRTMPIKNVALAFLNLRSLKQDVTNATVSYKETIGRVGRNAVKTGKVSTTGISWLEIHE